MTRKLLRGEIPITAWMGVTLTTHRVWQIVRQGQATSMVSIPLDAVQWIKLGRNHLLVVQAATPQTPLRVRGIISRAQIERQLGAPVEVTPIASSFSEIERALV